MMTRKFRYAWLWLDFYMSVNIFEVISIDRWEVYSFELYT